MVGRDRGADESSSSSSMENSRGSGVGLGTLVFVTACGIGIGLLTAPETGGKMRKRLRKGLASVGSEVADRWEDVSDRVGEMRKTGSETGRGVRKGVQRTISKLRDEIEDRWDATETRFAELEDTLEHLGEGGEERRGGAMSVVLGLAAGAGLAYFILADEAAPARSKVQELASDLRQQATDRWQQFRRSNTAATAGSTSASAGETRF